MSSRYRLSSPRTVRYIIGYIEKDIDIYSLQCISVCTVYISRCLCPYLFTAEYNTVPRDLLLCYFLSFFSCSLRHSISRRSPSYFVRLSQLSSLLHLKMLHSYISSLSVSLASWFLISSPRVRNGFYLCFQGSVDVSTLCFYFQEIPISWKISYCLKKLIFYWTPAGDYLN